MSITCTCGKQMKFHPYDSDEPIATDIDEQEGDFWYCECGHIQIGVIREIESNAN